MKDQCDDKFWIRRLFKPERKEKQQSGDSAPKVRVKDVRMSREEYAMYWNRDEGGWYIGREPEGKGREILRQRLWAELGLFEESTRTGKTDRDRYI